MFLFYEVTWLCVSRSGLGVERWQVWAVPVTCDVFVQVNLQRVAYPQILANGSQFRTHSIFAGGRHTLN